MKHILVVDDDAITREMLRMLFTPRGYNPAIASGLRQARELAQNAAFDLIVLDINLPDGNGFDLLRELRENNCQTCPVIILSALNQDVSMQRGLDLGATHYITKPFVLADLLEQVETLLAATDDPVR